MMRLLVSIAILALVGSVSTAYVDHDGALDTARLASTVPCAALAVAVLAAIGHRVTARR